MTIEYLYQSDIICYMFYLLQIIQLNCFLLNKNIYTEKKLNLYVFQDSKTLIIYHINNTEVAKSQVENKEHNKVHAHGPYFPVRIR